MDPLTCHAVDDHDFVLKYVAGQLEESEETQFEAHCLDCDRCWTEVQLALKVRVATRSRVTAASSTSSAKPDRSTPPLAWWLATAALVLLGVSGLWLARSDFVTADVVRGHGDVLRAVAHREPDSVFVSWTPVEGAARYVVTFATSSGEVLATREVTAQTLTLREHRRGEPLVCTVEAYAALGERLAASAPIVVPAYLQDQTR